MCCCLCLAQTRAKRLQKKAEHLRAEASEHLESIWHAFQAVVSILTRLRALDENALKPLHLGLAARALNVRGCKLHVLMGVCPNNAACCCVCRSPQKHKNTHTQPCVVQSHGVRC